MKRVYIPIAVLLLILLAGFIWYMNGTSAANSKNHTAKIFIVEPGQGVRAIAKNLKDQGLIKDQVVFFLLTKQTGLDNKIQAGSFRINPSMSAEEVAKQLTKGTLDIWVTVPEGQRAGEIADSLKQKMPGYDETWLPELEKNEGYLFPDTYLFPKDADITTIISIMRKNFDSKYATLDTTNSNLSQEQIVTIASLIEREAKTNSERPMVSGVIHNRFNQGMKLDLDASIQYALGNSRKWWPILTASGGNVLPQSPYNTYTHAGLPPSPISNPGLASLQAALNPSKTAYLYYFTDGNGTTHFAKTLDEQEANIDKYGL